MPSLQTNQTRICGGVRNREESSSKKSHGVSTGRWDFSPRTGTAGVLLPHTSMNDQSKSKHSRTKASGSEVNLFTLTSLSARPLSDFCPARQLMIDLGWLRLFQVIVSGYKKPATRRP